MLTRAMSKLQILSNKTVLSREATSMITNSRQNKISATPTKFKTIYEDCFEEEGSDSSSDFENDKIIFRKHSEAPTKTRRATNKSNVSNSPTAATSNMKTPKKSLLCKKGASLSGIRGKVTPKRAKSMQILQSPSESSEVTSRRSRRQVNKPDKYGEYLEATPTKHRAMDSSEEESENDGNEELTLKPKALFDTDDVEGQDMFKFKSRHTKHDLQNIVRSTISNSPTTSVMKTPRKSLLLGKKSSPFNKLGEATPKHVKDIMKKRIMKEVESDSDESDFSGGSSDEFVPDASDHEDTEASESSNQSDDEACNMTTSCKASVKQSRDTRVKPKDSDYFVSSDDYFMMNSSKKIATSDHTLQRLKNFNLNDNMDQNNTAHISEEHKKRITELNKSHESLFYRWLYVLNENFSVLLYGVGSKRTVLYNFQQEKLQDTPVIVVNGFFPSLTIKSILETIIIDLLECKHVPTNIGDVVALIDKELEDSDQELYLIVHNIDGPALRSAKAQAMLAGISQIRNVHLIATIDHINAPLLWDHSKLSKFNFTWWDVTTFLPYTEETSFENSLLSQRTGALQLSSLRSVHQSLTNNARGIYNIIINHQLQNCKLPHYQGFPFRELYSQAREQFLVSSDTALRAQLTEFLDHKLVRMKRSYDGGENLLIPIDNALLRQFQDTQDCV